METIYLKLFAIAYPLFVLMDITWLGFIMRPFYQKEVGTLMRPNADIPAALATWAVIVLGIILFSLPRMNPESPLVSGLFWGGLYGFFLYAVYDLTNIAVLKGWTLPVTIVDILWGTFACAMTGLVIAYLRFILFKS